MPVVTVLKVYRSIMGAAVINDLPDNVTAVGVPAKVLKQHGDLT